MSDTKKTQTGTCHYRGALSIFGINLIAGDRNDAPAYKVEVTQSCLTLCDPWTIQSMEFSRPEYWSG